MIGLEGAPGVGVRADIKNPLTAVLFLTFPLWMGWQGERVDFSRALNKRLPPTALRAALRAVLAFHRSAAAAELRAVRGLQPALSFSPIEHFMALRHPILAGDKRDTHIGHWCLHE